MPFRVALPCCAIYFVLTENSCIERIKTCGYLTTALRKWKRSAKHIASLQSLTNVNPASPHSEYGFLSYLQSPVEIPQSSFLCAQSLQSCPTLCDPMDHGPPGSSVHGILQARTLEWVAIPFRGSSQPRDQTPVSCVERGFFTI